MSLSGGAKDPREQPRPLQPIGRGKDPLDLQRVLEQPGHALLEGRIEKRSRKYTGVARQGDEGRERYPPSRRTRMVKNPLRAVHLGSQRNGGKSITRAGGCQRFAFTFLEIEEKSGIPDRFGCQRRSRTVSWPSIPSSRCASGAV